MSLPERRLAGARDADFRELLALVEELVGWLRVGTFDEQDGERSVWERARAVLDCYRRS